ncbi:hypothetical protein T484DRAFT_1799555, partial [Baffinella frigidus]
APIDVESGGGASERFDRDSQFKQVPLSTLKEGAGPASGSTEVPLSTLKEGAGPAGGSTEVPLSTLEEGAGPAGGSTEEANEAEQRSVSETGAGPVGTSSHDLAYCGSLVGLVGRGFL